MCNVKERLHLHVIRRTGNAHRGVVRAPVLARANMATPGEDDVGDRVVAAAVVLRDEGHVDGRRGVPGVAAGKRVTRGGCQITVVDFEHARLLNPGGNVRVERDRNRIRRNDVYSRIDGRIDEWWG